MMFGTRKNNLEHKLDLIYTALVVRDPGASIAAEAFEGLRKQVIAGATARHAHIAQLAEFDVAIQRGASLDDLAKLTSQWLDQAGVARFYDHAQREAFESTIAPGTPVDVEVPAYINTVTGQLVRQGRLRERKIPLAEDQDAEVSTPDSLTEPQQPGAFSEPHIDVQSAEPEAADPPASEPEPGDTTASADEDTTTPDNTPEVK